MSVDCTSVELYVDFFLLQVGFVEQQEHREMVPKIGRQAARFWIKILQNVNCIIAIAYSWTFDHVSFFVCDWKILKVRATIEEATFPL